MNNMMIRRLLYTFKRQWGADITYVQILSATVNDSTGSRDIQRTVLQIPATRLPTATVRKFLQDIGYLAADKNFTYGALNDFNKATFIFSQLDLPDGFQPNLNGYIVLNGKRYEKVSIDNLFDEGYIMVVQGVEGANPFARLDVRADDRLRMQSEATYALN